MGTSVYDFAAKGAVAQQTPEQKAVQDVSPYEFARKQAQQAPVQDPYEFARKPTLEIAPQMIALPNALATTESARGIGAVDPGDVSSLVSYGVGAVTSGVSILARGIYEMGKNAGIFLSDAFTGKYDPAITRESGGWQFKIARDMMQLRQEGLAGNVEAAEHFKRSVEGAALVASFVPGIATARLALPAVTAGAAKLAAKGLVKAPTQYAMNVAGRGLAFLIGEGLGGATYGGIRPLEEGHSRAGQMATDAAWFAAFGGVINGAIKARGVFRTFFDKLDKSKKILVQKRVAEILRAHEAAIAENGERAANLAPWDKHNMQVLAYQQALEEIDPNIVDLAYRELGHMQTTGEIAPRVNTFENVVLDAPSELKLPDAFNLELSHPVEVPRPVDLTLPPPKGALTGKGRFVNITEDEAGTVTLRAYRGVAAGRNPLDPGHTESTFMSDRPSYAALFTQGLNIAGSWDEHIFGGLYKLEFKLRKPLYVRSWSELQRGQATREAQELTKVHQKIDAVWQRIETLRQNRLGKSNAEWEIAHKEVQQLEREFTVLNDMADDIKHAPMKRNQAYIYEEIKAKGHDGIIVLSSEGDATEFMIFDQRAGRIVSKLDITTEELDNMYDHYGRYADHLEDLLSRHQEQVSSRILSGETQRVAVNAADLTKAGVTGGRDISERIANFIGSDIKGYTNVRNIPFTLEQETVLKAIYRKARKAFGETEYKSVSAGIQDDIENILDAAVDAVVYRSDTPEAAAARMIENMNDLQATKLKNGQAYIDNAAAELEAIKAKGNPIAIRFAKQRHADAIADLAAAQAYTGPAKDAQKLLTEVIHDAAEVNRTHKSITIEELNQRLIDSQRRKLSEQLIAASAEPQWVTLPKAPMEIEPTVMRGVPDRAKYMPHGQPGSIEQLALGHQAVDDAVSNLQMIDLMKPEIRSAAVDLERELADPRRIRLQSNERIGAAIDAALAREEPAATQGLYIELTEGSRDALKLETVDREIAEALKKRKRKPSAETQEVRRDLGKTLRREQAPIEKIPPEEAIQATWRDDIVPDAPTKPNAWRLLAQFDDNQLGAVRDRLNQNGYIMQEVMARLALGGTGATAFAAGGITEDRAVGDTLRTVGVGLMLASVGGPAWRKLMSDSHGFRKIVIAFSPEAGFSGAAERAWARAKLPATAGEMKGALTDWRSVVTQEVVLEHQFNNTIGQVFKHKSSKDALMYVLDEGNLASEWAQLTPAQQAEAANLHAFLKWLGERMQDLGILKQYRENYITHYIGDKGMQQWKIDGYVARPTLSSKGGFTEPRRIETLRELIPWAEKHGFTVNMDPAQVIPMHINAAYKAIANHGIKKTLARLGIIQKIPLEQATEKGLEPVLGIPQLAGWYGPNEVNQALRQLAAPRASKNVILNAMDTLKATWMRTIMMWFWEHGVNVLRGIPGLSANPVTWVTGMQRNMKSVRMADEAFVAAVNDGKVNFFQRPDYSAAVSGAFEKTLNKVTEHLPIAERPALTLKALQRGGAHLIHIQDKILWDNLVSGFQLFAYNTQMMKWTNSTKGAFTRGTPEYAKAALEAGAFANRVAGRFPIMMMNPGLARTLRILMFSPTWTGTRVSISAQAAGELGDILAGKLAIKFGTRNVAGMTLPVLETEAQYLPYKMRQIAIGIALTWAGSKLLSGEEPQYNEQNYKYYMRTGIRTSNGREIGVDLAGWWQDDLKLANAPLKFIAGRVNPALNVLEQTVSGKDYLGRDITPIENVMAFVRSFGPPAEAAELTMRALQGDPKAAEVIQRMSGVLAFGNVSALPRPIDVASTKIARRVLHNVGVPTNDDNVYQVARLVRSNFLAGNDLLDDQVFTLLAYMRRRIEEHEPFVHLWEKKKAILLNLIRGRTGRR